MSEYSENNPLPEIIETREMTPEAQEVLASFKEAVGKMDEELALDFYRKLRFLVEKNQAINQKELSDSRRRINSKNYPGLGLDILFGRATLSVADGSSGARIFIQKERGLTALRYNKPTGTGLYQLPYWQNFMNHFKSEEVALD